MTTLIAGCGYVGSALAARLVARGERVIALTRSGRALPEGVTPLRASLPDEDLSLPREIERVVYAVAPDERSDAAYERAYPDGVRSVLAAIARSGAALDRFVLVSSTAVYAEDAGGLVGPAGPYATGTPERVLEAERALPDETGVVARLSGIYGPGRDRIVRAVREGRTVGEPGRVGNRIHRDDAAAAIEHLLFLSRPFARVYDVTDTASVPMGELFAWIAREIGVGLDPALTSVPPIRTGKRIEPRQLALSGFSFRYPSYREGYGEMIRGSTSSP